MFQANNTGINSFDSANLTAANSNALVQANYATGASGEAAVRSVYDIGDRLGFNVSGQNRISDGFLPGDSITEVKNVGYQSLTSQMQDYLSYSQQEDIDFNLYVRGPGASTPTTFSAPLQQQINLGNVNIYYIPGTE